MTSMYILYIEVICLKLQFIAANFMEPLKIDVKTYNFYAQYFPQLA